MRACKAALESGMVLIVGGSRCGWKCARSKADNRSPTPEKREVVE